MAECFVVGFEINLYVKAVAMARLGFWMAFWLAFSTTCWYFWWWKRDANGYGLSF